MKKAFLNLTLSSTGKRPVVALQCALLRTLQECTLLSPQEYKLFSQLFEDELFYRSQEGKDLRAEKMKRMNLFRLRPSNAKKILQQSQLLATLTWNGAPIIPDFVTPHLIEVHFEQGAFLKGALISPSTCWELNKSLIFLPGPPHMVLKPPFLKVLHEDISWKIVDSIFLEERLAPLIKDEGAEAVVKLHLSQVATAADPLPILKLTDTTLGFANLVMEYHYSDDRSITYPYLSKESLQLRNPLQESTWEKDLLESGFTRRQIGLSDFFCPLIRAADAIQFLLEVGWTILNHEGKRLHPIEKVEITPSLTTSVLFQGGFKESPTLLDTVVREQRLIPLTSQAVGFLTGKNFEALKELAQEIAWHTPLQGLTNVNARRPSLSPAKWAAFAPRFSTQLTPSSVEDLTPSSAFRGTLRHYQQEGFQWLLKRYQTGLSSLLADDMGLGKTVQVLALLSRVQGPSLIIMPKSLLPNWKAELQRFLPSREVRIYEGISHPSYQAVLENLLPDTILLSSYAAGRLGSSELEKIDFSLLVLDEAQVIKNRNSLTAQALARIPAQGRLSLTGTPIENSLQDIVGHFHFLEPTLLQGIEGDLASQLHRIKRLTHPSILRRCKEEVLQDLPPLQEQVVRVEMSEGQRTLYDTFMASLKAGLIQKIVEEGLAAHRMEIVEGLLRLRQLCCHPALVPQLSLNNDPPSSGKFELVLEDIETLLQENKKIILFSQFSSMLHLFEKEAIRKKWAYLLLEGATTERGDLLAAFTHRQEPLILFATLKTGGVGLNLQAADYILLYDPWWNKAVEDQAIARAHRMGRVGAVTVKKYVTEQSVEEYVQQLKELKGSLQSHYFETDVDAITSFGIENLIKLF